MIDRRTESHHTNADWSEIRAGIGSTRGGDALGDEMFALVDHVLPEDTTRNKVGISALSIDVSTNEPASKEIHKSQTTSSNVR